MSQPRLCVLTLYGVVLFKPLNTLLLVLWHSTSLSFQFGDLRITDELDKVRSKKRHLCCTPFVGGLTPLEILELHPLTRSIRVTSSWWASFPASSSLVSLSIARAPSNETPPTT